MGTVFHSQIAHQIKSEISEATASVRSLLSKTPSATVFHSQIAHQIKSETSEASASARSLLSQTLEVTVSNLLTAVTLASISTRNANVLTTCAPSAQIGRELPLLASLVTSMVEILAPRAKSALYLGMESA